MVIILKKILGFAKENAGVLFLEIFFFRYGGSDISTAICLSWFLLGCTYLVNTFCINPFKSDGGSYESGGDIADKFFNKYIAGMFFQGGIYMFMSLIAQVDTPYFSETEVFVKSFLWYFGISVAITVIKELEKVSRGY